MKAGRGDARGARRADRDASTRRRGAPDADPAQGRARARACVDQKDCDTCHELDGEGENAGPNLKGRGTLAWTEAVIADAGQGRLFGEKNKMPKFAGKLTPAEIDQMTTFVLALKGK